MSKIYFFVESRIGQVPTLVLFSVILLLVAGGVLSFGEFQTLYNLVLGWFNG